MKHSMNVFVTSTQKSEKLEAGKHYRALAKTIQWLCSPKVASAVVLAQVPSGLEMPAAWPAQGTIIQINSFDGEQLFGEFNLRRG